MSFPPHPVQAPPGEFPILPGANWDEEARRWTYDLCGNVMMGLTVRREGDEPCDEPFPCGDRAWEPGLLEPITLHPIRADDRMNQEGEDAGYANREVCQYCYGVAAMTPDGLIVPILFSRPDVNDRFPTERVTWKVSVGAFFVCQPDDPSGVCEPGMIAGILSISLPPWKAVVLSAEPARPLDRPKPRVP